MSNVTVPANGTVNTTSRRLSGENATYTCDVSFELLYNTSGSDVRTCLDNGTWSGVDQQCIGKCAHKHSYLTNINFANSSRNGKCDWW